MSFDRLKKYSINIMIYSLIGAAVVAVAAVLAGDWNDAFSRALFSLFIVAVHSLIVLGFLQVNNDPEKTQWLNFFTNTVFFIVILSFFTAILGIWEALPGEVVSKLYATYFVFAFASLHGQVLFEATDKEKRIDIMVLANYVIMGLVIIMLLPLIWYSETEFDNFYYRFLTAMAIVDATLTFLVVILHKLYLQKHPKTPSQLFANQTILTTNEKGEAIQRELHQTVSQRRHMHPVLVILIVLLVLQFIGPLIFFLFAGL